MSRKKTIKKSMPDMKVPSYEMLKSLVNNVEVSINIFDLKGNRIFINPYFYHLTGRKNQSFFSSDMTTGENKKKGKYLTKKLKLAIKTGRHLEVRNFFYRSKFKKTRRYFDFNIGPLRDGQGETIGGYTMVKDVTTRYLARQRLLKMNQLLEKKVSERTKKIKRILEEKNILVSDVAHEAKTILTVIKGNMEMLNLKEKTNSPFEIECYDEINKEINKINKISSDLVFIAKAQQYSETLKPERFDLILLIKKILKKYKKMAGKEFSMQLRARRKCLCINADKKKIAMVVSNLLENFIKFNNQKKPALKINLKRKESMAHITFEDNGIGIERDKINLIFSPFFQADKTEKNNVKKRGFGLGLAICKKIIEAHKGTISVKSEGINKGTVFEIMLPIKKMI